VVGASPVIEIIVPTAFSTWVVRHCASCSLSFEAALPVKPLTASFTLLKSPLGAMFSVPCGVNTPRRSMGESSDARMRMASRTGDSRPGAIESSSMSTWNVRPLWPLRLMA